LNRLPQPPARPGLDLRPAQRHPAGGILWAVLRAILRGQRSGSCR